MVCSRKFERRFATAVVASGVVLLMFASVAQAIDRISVLPGFNAPVNAISEPDSNGTRYLGGNFTAFNPWDTGNGALVGASSGDVNLSFPKVNGVINATAADGSGGFYIGGDFTCIGPNTSGSCDGTDDVVRNRAAHINANGSVDLSWNPNLDDDVFAIGVSGSSVYLGGFFTTAGGTARNRAAAVGTDGTLSTSWNPNVNGSVYAIGVSGDNVYLGGAFTTVGVTARNRAAAVDATTGVATDWNPNLNNDVFAIALSGSNVYLGGFFTTAGVTARNHAAAVDATTGVATSWDPNLNEEVFAIALSGSNVYLGGEFTTVGGTARNYAAAVDTAGTLTSWNPDVNSTVYAIGVSGSNVYLGGEFTTVGGIARNRAAAVTTDGAGTLTSWNPNLNEDVRAIGVSGSNVYLGGWFTTVGGIAHNRAAAVGTNGTLDPSWNPNVNNNVRAIELSGSNVYLGGWFTTVGGIARNRAAAVTTGGAGTLSSWNPNVNGLVDAIAVSGSNVYLGGQFTTVGGTTRNYVAAVGTDGTLDLAWDPDLDYLMTYSVNAIGVSGSTVYLGGFFDRVGGIARNGAAAVDATTGVATAWDPNPIAAGDLGGGVRAIELSGSNVYLGGDFITVGGQSRSRAAAVDNTNGTLTSWNPNLNSNVDAIAVSGSNVYLGGPFTTVGGTTRNYVAAVGTDGTLDLAWNPNLNGSVNAIGVSGSTVYLGGDFTTVGGIARNYSAAVGTDGTLLGEWPTLLPPMLLSVTKSGSGSGMVASSPAGIDCGATCSTTFASGTSVTLTATPVTGSSLTGWSGAGCSGTSTCTVVMSEARAVNAEFAVVPPGSFNLAVSKSGTGGGTVTSSPAGIDCGSDCSETLVDGSSVTLTASPAAGSSFAAWSGAGCSGKSTCTVVMSEAKAVDAKFTKKPSNVFPTPTVKAGASALSSSVRVRGPGTITQRVTRSSNLAAVLTVCKTSGKATKAGWVKLSCKLSAATRAALRKRSLRVSMKTTFTPTGGLPASKTQVVTLKSQRPPPYTG